MKGLKRVFALSLSAFIIMLSMPMHALAANDWLDRAKDDNVQQLYLLTRKNPADYNFLITTDPVERQILYSAAQEIVKGCTTDEQKTMAVYDYVTTNTYYDWDGLNASDYAPVDPYSVMVNHYAVCEGYATLFAELLNSVGIPCVTFHGASNSDEPGATRDDESSWDEYEYNDIDHAWNAAYVGGQWKYYDPTWDSRGGRQLGVFIPGNSTRDYYAVAPESLGANHRTAYLINSEGGFRLKDGKWLRYDNSGAVFSGIGYDYYKLTLSYYRAGIPATGKTIVNFQLVSFSDTGVYEENLYDYTGWFAQDKDWYYILDGVTCYGWGRIDGKWYYLNDKTCKMERGWKFIGGKWYYLGTSGAMATGWQKLGTNWYYLNDSGAMATGWIKLGSAWYYLSSNGVMTTGWKQVGSKWYYFYPSGQMAANTVIGGYRLGASGTY